MHDLHFGACGLQPDVQYFEASLQSDMFLLVPPAEYLSCFCAQSDTIRGYLYLRLKV